MHATTHEDFSETGQARSCAGRMNKKPWSIYEVGATIGAFALFWPLGLVALFVKMKKGELWNGASAMQAPWSNWQKHADTVSNFTSNWQPKATSGNVAFDEYRRAELDKLEALRRKLDEDRKAFDDFVTKLRHAKDREDFEHFMNERNNPPTTAN